MQLYSAVLYNANVKGFVRGNIYTGSGKKVCVPGLNCYSCPGAVAACPLGALQAALNKKGFEIPFAVLGFLFISANMARKRSAFFRFVLAPIFVVSIMLINLFYA